MVYELILSHGRTDLYLFFAGLNRDYEKVVEHWVTEEQWLKAIDVLNRQVSLQDGRYHCDAPLVLLLLSGALGTNPSADCFQVLTAGLARSLLPLRVGPHATSTQRNRRLMAATFRLVTQTAHPRPPAASRRSNIGSYSLSFTCGLRAKVYRYDHSQPSSYILRH